MIDLKISNFIWGIPDDVLRDIYVRGKYRDVILPMTVIRRLDAVLQPTKDAVLSMRTQLDAAGITNQDQAPAPSIRRSLPQHAPLPTPWPHIPWTPTAVASRLRSVPRRLLAQRTEVLEKFKFRNQLPTLVEADALGFLLEKFLDGSINLSPRPVPNGDGSVRPEGLDNHGMGAVFEELIRRFNEENNEEAGERFTPRDVARLIFLPVAEEVMSGAYLVYDGACGTGGMLTVAEETLTQLATERGKEAEGYLQLSGRLRFGDAAARLRLLFPITIG